MSEHCRIELRNAFEELRSRCLYQAAKWTAEQLSGLPEAGEEAGSSYTSCNPAAAKVPLTAADQMDLDSYYLGVSFFENKEYSRCVRALAPCKGPRATFLQLYARYLLGEKRKEEDRLESTGPLGRPQGANTELDGVESECQAALKGLERAGQRPDPFLLYLRGLALADLNRGEEAVQCLSQSLQIYPLNWSAWHSLMFLVSSPASLPHLPDHWTRICFEAALHMELQSGTEALERLQAVLTLFPRSSTALLQAATAQYNLRNYSEAQQLFEDLIQLDPDRIEGMDIYSNILYVQEAFGPLSALAHRMTRVDKYRAETCCVIGNYYSLRNLHEKAVIYFQRALKLNPQYLSAWTLMGHEYVEMKNPSAAIDCYRRAVDINPRDYRAWYGLGQTYELLLQPYYALYYYRRALQLRPRDPRMWCALGTCYESYRLAMYPAAIRCYRQAAAYQDPDGMALQKLAKLHEVLGERDQAAHYYMQVMDRAQRAAEASLGPSGGLTPSDPSPPPRPPHPYGGLDASVSLAPAPLSEDAVEACVFLAQYFRETMRLGEAETYCQRLLDVGGGAKEKAKSLLREIRALQSASHPSTGPVGSFSFGAATGPTPARPGLPLGSLPGPLSTPAGLNRPTTSHGLQPPGAAATGVFDRTGAFPGFQTPLGGLGGAPGMGLGGLPLQGRIGEAGEDEMEEGSDLELSD